MPCVSIRSFQSQRTPGSSSRSRDPGVTAVTHPPSVVTSLFGVAGIGLPGDARLVTVLMPHFQITPPAGRRLATALAVLSLVAAGGRAVAGDYQGGVTSPFEANVARAELVNVPRFTRESKGALDFDSLYGRSGQLRVRLMLANEADFYPTVAREHEALRTPGFRTVRDDDAEAGFHFVTLTPWTRKLGAYVNGYHVGWWPAERQRMSERYANPDGFIEVTRDNVDAAVSTHFILRDFVTHDQPHVWPKYVVLQEALLDKLELTLEAVESYGMPVRHVKVLSGFRSPQYNARGVGEGMAQASRHQFGDAADLIIDANRDGRMDDLNRDGRVTFDDLRVLERAVQLVEHRFPDLVGGLGLYRETGPSGPFVHIDVRGKRARWTNTRPRSSNASRWPSAVNAGRAEASGRCLAEGEMAVLCQGIR